MIAAAAETIQYDVDRLEFMVVCVAATLIILTIIKHWRLK